MDSTELKNRTKKVALDIIKIVQSLPRDTVGFVIGKQLLRSATSVAANYRAVCRSRSRADFVNKLGVVEEEADETEFWIELLIDSGVVKIDQIKSILIEVKEITAIIAASHLTAKSRFYKNRKS